MAETNAFVDRGWNTRGCRSVSFGDVQCLGCVYLSTELIVLSGSGPQTADTSGFGRTNIQNVT